MLAGTSHWSNRPLVVMGLAAALIFMVVLGGTDAGRYLTPVRMISTALGATFVLVWLRFAPREADTVDRLALGATLLFLLACVTSQFMRDSFDAATTAVAFTAALFVARGASAALRVRDLAITVLALIGLSLSVSFLVLWGGVWLKWSSISGAGFPPLDLTLPVGAYRHYHVVGTTVAVLMPALVVLGRRPRMWPLGVFGLAASAVVLFMSGSRTAWLALALGMLLSGLLLAGPRIRRIPSRFWLLAAAGLVLLLVAGVGQPIVTRLTATSTIELRTAIWGASLGQWLTHPLVGSGPGSFFSSFTLSGYFDTYLEVGRHADSALIQLLAEAGLVGVGALALLLIALASGIRAAAASWAPLAGLLIFGFASLTDNPSDSGHLVLIALVWMALATPRGSTPVPRRTNRGVRIATYASAVVIAIASASTLAASWAYDRAATASGRFGTEEVVAWLRLATTLDPSFAMYQRELGVWLLATGDADGAVTHAAAAARLNPADATAQRAIAIAALVDGRPELALAAARRAVELGGLHAENQLTLAYVAAADPGGSDEADRALVAALQPFPWLPASPGWASYFPEGDALRLLLERADRSWSDRLLSTGRYGDQRAWLAAMLGRSEGAGTRVRPTVLLIQCELAAAEEAAGELGAQRATLAGLISQIVVARVSGMPAADFLALARLRSALLGSLAATETPAASPLAGHVEDTRLYRRLAMAPAAVGPLFPTPDAGLSAWLRDPRGAALRGAPGSGLAECGS